MLNRALGGHLVAFVDLLSCCFPLVKVVFTIPFYCAHIASVAVYLRACALSPPGLYIAMRNFAGTVALALELALGLKRCLSASQGI